MENLIVSSSPHITGGISTRRIMLDVIIALLPAGIASVVIFGPICAAIIALSIIGAVAAEYVCRRVMKREQTIGDLSAVVTGFLLALNLPATSASLWMAPLGSIIAITVVKQCFGGLGQNFVNPAIAGRIILMMSFTSYMSVWPEPMAWLNSVKGDAVAYATPLAQGAQAPDLLDMLLGVRGGCLGETCVIAIVIGMVYLFVRKVISPVIPLVFCGSAVLFCWLFSGFEANPLYTLMSGGLLLGSVFMATDYVTSPVTVTGKVIYAVGCGLFTALIRQFGSLPEGVSFAILIMNILTPHIDSICVSRPFGAVKAKEAK